MTIEPRWQTNGIFDVYKLLDAIRERPGLYLGTPSLTKLRDFLQGYRSALMNNDIPYRQVGFWNIITFDTWIRKHFDLPYNSQGWANNILKHCNGDEAEALAKFFELLDEFRQQEKSESLS